MSSHSVRIASRVHSAVTARQLAGRRALRGFTLIELLAVVVIMGILAAIGLGGFRRRAQEAGTLEVKAMLKAIAAAQEAHRGQFMVYLNVSGDLDTLFPREPDGKSTTFYQGTTAGPEPNWRRLAPETPQQVSFGYATVAGLPGTTTYPALRSGVPEPTWPTAVEPWYIAQAVGDEDGDNREAVAVISSFASHVYWKDPEE